MRVGGPPRPPHPSTGVPRKMGTHASHTHPGDRTAHMLLTASPRGCQARRWTSLGDAGVTQMPSARGQRRDPRQGIQHPSPRSHPMPVCPSDRKQKDSQACYYTFKINSWARLFNPAAFLLILPTAARANMGKVRIILPHTYWTKPPVSSLFLYFFLLLLFSLFLFLFFSFFICF